MLLAVSLLLLPGATAWLLVPGARHAVPTRRSPDTRCEIGQCAHHSTRAFASSRKRALMLTCALRRNFYLGHNYEGVNGPLDGDTSLAPGVYEVTLPKPCGIRFEENAYPKGGVTVIGLIDGGNAEQRGVQVGDDLVGVTAIRVVGAKWDRQMFKCDKLDYDTVVDAIGSNNDKFDCEDVVMQFFRPPKEPAPKSDAVE